MSIELLTLLLFLGILLTFAAGIPVAFALGAIAMLFGAFVWGPQCFNIIPHTATNAISGFILLAVPLFLFMGQVLLRSGLGEAMFHAMHVLAGRVRGGLAIAVIVVCTFLGAMVGIIGAGIMLSGTIALPTMLKRGYNRYLALGSVMAGGGMGILIPPSVPMIVFCSQTNASIGKMFAGGMVPGIIMSSLFIIYIAGRSWIQPELCPALPKEERTAPGEKLIALRDALVAFGLIFTVLGTILIGAATPTEAAAIGVVGACLIAMFYRRFNIGVLKEASINTMKMTGLLVWILIGAMVFTNFHMMMGAGKLLNHLATFYNLPPMGVITMMQVSMIVLGCFMDELLIVLICAPLYTPIAVSLGYDPIWFGILMILNMEIAIQTPPYGFALFYLKAVAPPDVTMLDIYKSIAPFLAMKFVVLGLVMFFPQLAIWLPNLIFG